MSTDGITPLHFSIVDQSLALCEVTGFSLAKLQNALSLWLCESPDPMTRFSLAVTGKIYCLEHHCLPPIGSLVFVICLFVKNHKIYMY